MPRSPTSQALILAALCLYALAGAAKAQPAGNQAGFMASGQTATLDCAGGRAEIMGSGNVLTITGKCTRLDLAGSGNKITIEFGPTAEIAFVGSGNAISWTSTDGKSPRITYLGSGNTLTPPVQ